MMYKITLDTIPTAQFAAITTDYPALVQHANTTNAEGSYVVIHITLQLRCICANTFSHDASTSRVIVTLLRCHVLSDTVHVEIYAVEDGAGTTR